MKFRKIAVPTALMFAALSWTPVLADVSMDTSDSSSSDQGATTVVDTGSLPADSGATDCGGGTADRC